MLANCTNTGNRLVQVGVEDVSSMGVDELCRLLQDQNVVSDGCILEEFRSIGNAFSLYGVITSLCHVLIAATFLTRHLLTNNCISCVCVVLV